MTDLLNTLIYIILSHYLSVDFLYGKASVQGKMEWVWTVLCKSITYSPVFKKQF